MTAADSYRITQLLLLVAEDADCAGPDQPVTCFPLTPAEVAAVDELLGRGEVSGRIAAPWSATLWETRYPGLWRVQDREGDRIEVGPVPAPVTAAAQAGAADSAGLADDLPPELMNAPALLAEISAWLRDWQPDQPNHVLNLTLLPLASADRALLAARLGQGPVVLETSGYRRCHIVSTARNGTAAGCWLVSYQGPKPEQDFETLEIGAVPAAACAGFDDLRDSAQHLRRRLAEPVEISPGP